MLSSTNFLAKKGGSAASSAVEGLVSEGTWPVMDQRFGTAKGGSKTKSAMHKMAGGSSCSAAGQAGGSSMKHTMGGGSSMKHTMGGGSYGKTIRTGGKMPSLKYGGGVPAAVPSGSPMLGHNKSTPMDAGSPVQTFAKISSASYSPITKVGGMGMKKLSSTKNKSSTSKKTVSKTVKKAATKKPTVKKTTPKKPASKKPATKKTTSKSK